MSVAVVTDSTAYLPDELTEGYGIHVVPLYVVLAGRSGREGWDIGPGEVARTLAVGGQGQRLRRARRGPVRGRRRRRRDRRADGAGDRRRDADLLRGRHPRAP